MSPSSHAEMVITIDDDNKPFSEKDDVFRRLYKACERMLSLISEVYELINEMSKDHPQLTKSLSCVFETWRTTHV